MSASLQAEKGALEQQLQELQQHVQQSGLAFRGEAALAAISEISSPMGGLATVGNTSSSFSSPGFKPTELLSRLTQAEQALSTERGKNKELQLYMDRILKDVSLVGARFAWFCDNGVVFLCVCVCVLC